MNKMSTNNQTYEYTPISQMSFTAQTRTDNSRLDFKRLTDEVNTLHKRVKVNTL